MTLGEFLNRLDRVRKTPEGWSALCPGHDDKNPSLSVGEGEAGQILLRCFAGCPAEAIVAAVGLRLADLFPERAVAPKGGGVFRASDLPPVAEWLRSARGLPASEIGRMWATETPKGPAVVFRYEDDSGRLLYEKLRSVSAKGFWRRPSGKDSVLYGLSRLADSASDRVIVVEGELDCHVLSAVGLAPVVSVPDGTGSRLTRELLEPLAPFREIIIATDADPAGDVLARKLAAELMPERCRRLRFALGARGKDANDALRAGWTRADFERAIDAAGPSTSETIAPTSPREARRDSADGPAEQDEEESSDSSSRRYQVIDGRMCYLRTDRKGNDIVETLANFDARVDEEITFDDGAETRREFRISGKLASGDQLASARVNAADFGGLAWVTREWGIRAVVSAGTGTRDHLRTAIQHLSTPTSRRIFRHTGWIDHEGDKVFLYQGGAIGAEGIEVDIPRPLDRFTLPAKVDDVRDAMSWSLRFLRCGPPEVTIPLLAAVYVAPISTVLNPDVSVWLHGRSGSLKSTLSALCQAHFGDFDRKTLSGSWTSTENSLEQRLFILADVLSVIDDYAPQSDPRTQKDLDRRVQRILRNVGNRASRGRLGADLNHRPERPPRGFLLCNGEDIPPGLSILARLVPVEVERHALKIDEISALQAHVQRLRHAMAGYITWLRPQMGAPARFLRERDTLRDQLQSPGVHLRQPEAIATLLLGLELALAFAEEVGATDHFASAQLRAQAREVLGGIVKAQGALLEAADPTHHFLQVLGALLAQGKICLLDHRCEGTAPDIEMIGWRKGDMALVIPEAAHRRVALFVRDTGGFWNPSRGTLQKDLIARGILKPANDG
ncbi:MAG TPA: toprim domain-containing protein, partial [Polyangia bacterium]